MFLNMTSILVAFNIAKSVTKDGREIDPEIHFTTGITSSVVGESPQQSLHSCFSLRFSHLEPFECRIIPRSPGLLASLSST